MKILVHFALNSGPVPRAIKLAKVFRVLYAPGVPSFGIAIKIAVVPVKTGIDAVGLDFGVDISAVVLLETVKGTRFGRWHQY